MRRIGIIQARMGSTRLPGKVLRPLAGRPMLARQLERLRRCRELDDLVIATSDEPGEEPLVALGEAEGVQVFRGSEHDVLSRFVGAARMADADVVVRLTGDCPLIEPTVVDRVVLELTDHTAACDYASNVVRRSFPRGLDAEALFMDTLLRMDRMAERAPEREHVTVIARSVYPELFRCRDVVDADDWSAHRWTVDSPDDFAFVAALFDALDMAERHVGYAELKEYLRAHPRLARLDDEGHTWDPNARPSGGSDG